MHYIECSTAGMKPKLCSEYQLIADILYIVSSMHFIEEATVTYWERAVLHSPIYPADVTENVIRLITDLYAGIIGFYVMLALFHPSDPDRSWSQLSVYALLVLSINHDPYH